MTIEEVMRQHEESLRTLPNVTAVGIGEKNGQPVIVVFVSRKIPESDLQPKEVVPKNLDGYAVDVRSSIQVYPAS